MSLMRTQDPERTFPKSWQNDTDAYRRFQRKQNKREKRRQDIERYGDPTRTTPRHPPVSGPFCTLCDRRNWSHERGCWWEGVSRDPWAGPKTRWFQTEKVA